MMTTVSGSIRRILPEFAGGWHKHGQQLHYSMLAVAATVAVQTVWDFLAGASLLLCEQPFFQIIFSIPAFPAKDRDWSE
jgi:hypothetical protein